MISKKLIVAHLCLGLLVGCGTEVQNLRVSKSNSSSNFDADMEALFSSGERSEQLSDEVKFEHGRNYK